MKVIWIKQRETGSPIDLYPRLTPDKPPLCTDAEIGKNFSAGYKFDQDVSSIAVQGSSESLATSGCQVSGLIIAPHIESIFETRFGNPNRAAVLERRRMVPHPQGASRPSAELI